MKLLTRRLIEAKELLIEKGIWHGDVTYRATNSDGTYAICAWLAVDKSSMSRYTVEDVMFLAIKDTTGEWIDDLSELYRWNDRSSDETILRMYDRAIEISKAEPEDVVQFAHGAEPASDYIGGSWPEDH